jgi:hypothetical protein
MLFPRSYSLWLTMGMIQRVCSDTSSREQEAHHSLETAVPYTAFVDAGFSISVATETGTVPSCDAKMLTGWTQKLLVR